MIPRLASKAAIGLAAVVFLTSLLILFVTSAVLTDRLTAAAEAQLLSRLERELSVAAHGLDRAKRDARTLALGQVLAAYEAEGAGPAALDRLRRSFGRILSVREEYRQIRFLDAKGLEVVRAERSGGRVVVVPEHRLQDKSHRDYFRVLADMAPGSGLAAQVSLNREFGGIERPLRPTIRVLAPVHDAGGAFVGGVVLNMDAGQALPPRRSGEIEFRAVLPDGSYALHPDPSWEHGLELGTGLGFEREFGLSPSAFEGRAGTALRLEGAEGALLVAQGWLVTGGGPAAARWRIVASLPERVALAEVRATVLRMTLAVLAVAALTSLIGIAAVHRVVLRAKALSEGAARVAAGRYDEPVPVHGRDELAETARAFNGMMEQIRNHSAREAEGRASLSQLNAELLRSNGALADFARMTSHDLKSPLRPLALLPDWIEEDLPDVPAEVREHLDEMRRQATRMSELVDGLLRYSLAGTSESHAAPVDMHALVGTVLATLGTGPAFEFALDLPEAPVVAVATELDVVIRNLAQNAVAHHDRGGGRIGIAVAQAAAGLTVAVTDDGPGIPFEYRRKVLDPLVTLRARDRSGGNGLGLAIVAKIAARWNGHVEVLANPEGRGTMVRVTLGAHRAAIAA